MPEISIGTLSKRTGMAVSAIRYYEEVGLIHPNRTASGQRRFAKSDIRRIAFVIATQRLGFSLPEIRSQLALYQTIAHQLLRIGQCFRTIFKPKLMRAFRI